jgi:DNA-binding response OmpR family regulator
VILVEFNLTSEDPAQPWTANGSRLVRQFRALEPSVPILMYTVMEGELYKTTSLDAGVDEFISKTGSFSSFLSRLQVHVRRHVRQREGGTTRLPTSPSRARMVGSIY